MKRYKIFVNNEEIDLYPEANKIAAITKMIADSNDLSKRKKDNVKTLTVPGTANNRRIFNFAEDINSVIDTTTKPTIRIESNEEKVFFGVTRVTTSVIDGEKNIVEFNLSSVGGNADWIERIGNKYLSDLDYSDQNHYKTAFVQQTSEVVGGGREYVYDIIDRGKFTGVPNANGKETIQIDDRYPALSFTSLFDRIFIDAGYRVVSNWRDSSEFTTWYWNFVNEYMKHPQTVNDTYRVTARQNINTQYISSNQLPAIISDVFQNCQILSPYYNVGGCMNQLTNGRYLCKGGKGKYTFELDSYFRSTGNVYTSTTPSGTFVYTSNVIYTWKKINRYKNNTPIVCSGDASYVIELPANTNGDNWLTPQHVVFTKEFELEWGDEVYLEIEMNQYRDGVPLLSTYYTLANGRNPLDVYFTNLNVSSVVGELEMGENQYVDWSVNMPENVLQIDFIQGLKDLANLHFVTDVEARTVYIEPRDEFYTQPFEDWSNLLHEGSQIQIEFIGNDLSNLIKYKYKQDSNDKFIEQYNKQNVVEYGSYDAPIENASAKKDTEKFENKLFAATWMNTSERIGAGTTMLPRMWSDVSLPPKTTKFNPRVLVYRGRKNLPAGEQIECNQIGLYLYQIQNPGHGVRTTYPDFVFYDNKELNTNNLSFADNDYSYGLFNKYFLNSHKTKDDGRRYYAEFDLNDTRVANIDFRKQKYIEQNGNGAYFILEKISDFKSEDMEPTKCELVKYIGRRTLPKLNHQTVAFVPTPVLGVKSVQAISLSEDGKTVLIAGEPALELKSSGKFQEAGETVYATVGGVIVPVLYTDSNNNYQQVKTS